MKKLLKNLLFFSVIGSAAFLYSCGGDDEVVLPAAPSLNVTTTVNGAAVTGTAIEAVLGDVVVMDITANTPGGFNVLRISGGVDADAITRTDLGLDAGATSGEVEFTLELTDEALIGADVEVIIEVVDDSDQTATVTYTISVSAPPSPEARGYTAVLLSAPLGDKTAYTFFSSNTGLIYSPLDVTGTTAAVSPNIDFGYYYGATDNASLASPKAYSLLSNAGFTAQVAGWGTLNETILKTTTLTASAFNEVTTWADIEEVYEASTDAGSGVKTALAVNQVLAFKTASTKTGGSKIGLIFVKSITAGDGVTGKIDLEVLVQEEAGG